MNNLVRKFPLRTLCRVALIAFAMAGASPALAITSDEYFDRAQGYFDRSEWQASIIELKNALQLDPDSAAARLLLGKVYLETFDPVSAEKELLRAQSLGTSSTDLTEGLGNAWLQLGRFDRILREITADVSSLPKHKAMILTLRGRAHLGLGNLDEAAKDFAAAVNQDSENSNAHAGLGRIAFLRSDIKAVEENLTRALAADPKAPNALRLKGDLHFARRQYSEAEAVYQELVDINPLISNTLLLANASAAQGKFDEAVIRIDPILRALPLHRGANYLRSLVAYQSKDYKTAKFHADQALLVAPDHSQFQLLAGASNFALGNNEQALSLLRRHLASAPTNNEARRMLGATLLRLGKVDEAREILQPLEAGAPASDSQLLAMVGAAALRSGDLESSKAYLQQLVVAQPENAAARAQLGAVELALGQADQGILELEQALELDPNLDRALLTLIVAHLSNREFEQALDLALRLREKLPENAQALTLVGASHTGLGDFDAASEAFEAALKIRPGAPDAGSNLASIKLRQGKPEEARALYNQVLENNRDHLRTLLRLAALERLLGRRDESLKLLERAAERHPESVPTLVMLGRTYLERGDAQNALALTEPLLDGNPNNPPVLEVVGQARLQIGDPEKSLELFQRLVELIPNAAGARIHLARVYETTRNFDQAEAEFRKVLEINPDHLQAKFALARISVEQGNLAGAKEILDELRAASPEAPALLEMEAKIALVEKRPNDAIKLLKQALEKRDNRDRLILLARAQAKTGAVDDGVATLHGWLQKYPEDLGVRTFLARSYLDLGRVTDAQQEYGEIVTRAPENIAALNNLAWLDWRLGNAERGLVHARRALELSPDNPRVMDTVGMILLDQGNSAEALTLLRRANEKLPEQPVIQFHFARALVAEGETDQARKLLSKLVEVDREFDGRDEAEALLKQLTQTSR